MCTVTWFHTAEGFELFSNRDERRTRPPAQPPRVFAAAGVRVLAPLDGEAGGSWLTVNELGVALCLLNLYEVEVPATPSGGGQYTSRGLLVTDLAGARSAADAAAGLADLTLARYRPFTLLVLDAERGVGVHRWDGTTLTAPSPERAIPLVSSGYDVEGATRARRELLASFEAREGSLNGELLERFHRSHRPERGPYSPCMHRWDAETVSFSHVSVRADEGVFRYVSGAPCEAGLGVEARLELRRQRGGA